MVYDILIIGGGPAGLTAALYAKRANKTALIMEKSTFGGQITYSPKVENIPGFTQLSGNEFAEKMVDQVLIQGADTEMCEALGIRDEGELKIVSTDSGDFYGKAVIIATGAKHRLLGIEGEEELVGNGISFCAVCDGAFYEGQTVAVIGGGNSALQEALLLSDLVKKLYIVQNLDFLTGEEKLAEEIKAKPNAEIIYGTVVDKYLGENEVNGIVLKEVKTGATRELSVDGVFLAIGLIPQNEPFANVLTLDKYGYADVNETCKSSVNGIFVAGDCRKKRVRQVTTAAADGAVAALAACEYLDALKNA